MHRRSLLALLPFVLAAGPAVAAGGKAADKAGAAQYIDISPVALPVTMGDRVVNYIFVGVRLNLTAMANVQKLREREPFFRDALVRAAHRTPFTGKTNFTTIDVDRLKAVMLKEAVRLGGKDIQSVAVTSQTAKRQSGLPKHPGAPPG
ncbi:MAG: hypothetical protein Q8L59_07135 [Phenylobacterium sp.]|uniref:hypothetical protein n=1 Tax=Phenylobacterium sp. TaxID=1871053 RepID=UPI0027327A25|nr:hypothetical protein [Phenylobacterium sp.]MDP1641943.1 hypothetical protein [Phenylobacterium sp.]MDP3117269.1 hypothetical protein [Phenylobacterium sp.]MDP3381832.1 hypothetical protein [Phenylobacterium sp.]